MVSKKAKIISVVCVSVFVLCIAGYFIYQYGMDQAFHLALKTTISNLTTGQSDENIGSLQTPDIQGNAGSNTPSPSGGDDQDVHNETDANQDTASSQTGSSKNISDLEKYVTKQDKATVMGIISSALSASDYAYLASLAATDINKAKSEASKKLSGLSSSQKQQLIQIYNKYIGLLK